MSEGMLAYRGVPRPLSELVADWVAVPPELTVSDLTLDSRAATPGEAEAALRAAHGCLEFRIA